MPTDKRERQRAGRDARLEAARAAQKRAARRRQLIAVGALVAVVGGIGFVISRSGDGDTSVAAGKAATTTVTTAVAPTTEPVPAATPEAGECPPAEGAPEPRKQFPAPPPMCIDPARSYSATMETDAGSFTIDLDPSRAPRTVNNFVFLARNRFYEGVPFHRVIPGFVVQGGDGQNADGTGGPGYKFDDELPKAGEYQIGSVAMANSGPNTNGSQFYVITGPQGVQLPPNYSLFGKVGQGLDVVKDIEAEGSPGGTPKTIHKITKVTITEKDG